MSDVRVPWGIHREPRQMPVQLVVTVLVWNDNEVRAAVDSLFALGAIPKRNDEWGDVFPITGVSEVLP